MRRIFLVMNGAPQGQANLSSAGNNPQNTNVNENALGSKYAQQYGHSVTSILARATRNIIFDASPKQYADLKILNLVAPKQVMSDEYFYHESGFGRDPIVANAIAAQIAAGTTQAIPIMNTQAVSTDMIVIYPDGVSRGTITAVNATTGVITVTAPTGGILPAIPISAQGALVFTNLAPVEADAATGISQYFRMNTIERSNYIQLLAMAQRWGRIEMEKYKNNGTLANYIELNKNKLYEQFRMSMSNIFWNGEQAEVTLANGQKAKTAGGVFPIMQQVGSANTSVTTANSMNALEQLALDTEYGAYGETRFLFATPRVILAISKQYKSPLTRYFPNDDMAKLNLKSIMLGSTEIVFVPIKRFEEPSCFPSAFRSRAILLDMKNIQQTFFLPEEMGDTLSRVNNGTLNAFTDSWIAATTGLEFYNPLGCGWLDITDIQ